MTPQPTGRLVRHSDGVYVVLDRVFLAPIDDVWGSLTRPYRLATWLGECTGHVSTGAVRIRKAGIPDMEWEHVAVLECEAPTRFRGEVGSNGDSRRVYWHLTHANSYTTVTLGQRRENGTLEPLMGVRTEYCLDRLVAARAKRPLPVWDDYYPALLPHYEKLVTEGAHRTTVV
ncbi:SRPBCC domain-containing protein [Microbacterium sp. STN6]|uniref:SRPBCC domain-containing protein n=1 Tax=Microbacterium sp. STN6 TaxID=2995588 RepID=UPI002260ABDD|nr:SRPBCC domain-containing protein [Microbacterium sp. STN6]MCX7522614.1 SRPBCC domain-containing protein [Microbacterium sp. STN6]